jgi:hypothetical protein
MLNGGDWGIYENGVFQVVDFSAMATSNPQNYTTYRGDIVIDTDLGKVCELDRVNLVVNCEDMGTGSNRYMGKTTDGKLFQYGFSEVY